MKTYFSRITADHWQAKNKLQQAAKDLAREMDRRMISEIELESFKKDFGEKIAQLNQKFPRCNPLSFWIDSDSLSEIELDDISIYCDGVFNMSLFLVKEETIKTIMLISHGYARAVDQDNDVPAEANIPGNVVYLNNGMVSIPANMNNQQNNYYLCAGSPPTCLKSNDCHGVFNEHCPDNVTCPIHKIFRMNFSTLNKF